MLLSEILACTDDKIQLTTWYNMYKILTDNTFQKFSNRSTSDQNLIEYVVVATSQLAF